MKKGLLIIFAVVAVIAAAAVAILSFDKSTGDDRAKIEDAIFCYFNVDQLAKKGAFENYFTPEQRRLYASMVTADIADQEAVNCLYDVIQDFNCSGIDFTKPVYGYFDEVDRAFVFVAEVVDVKMVDNTLGSVAYLLEQEGEESFEIVRDGDARICVLDSDLALAYNDSRAALVICEEENLAANIDKALSRKLADLTLFGASDMAIYMDANKLTSYGKQYIDEEIALYGDEDLDYLIEELNEQKLLIDELNKYITPGAYMIADLTFDPGRVTMSYKGYGFNTVEYDAMMKRSSGSHLEYIDEDALMVMNVGVEGKRLAKSITTLLNSSLTELLGIYLSGEERMVMAILCDAIESISGDVTLVVDSIDGQMNEHINYFSGRVEHRPQLDSVAAAVMMDVTDSYIITNVGQYAMGLLRKVGEDKYVGQFGNIVVDLEQNDGLLFGGVNMKPEKSDAPATCAKWANDVANSYFYWVVDVDNVLANSFVKSCNDLLIEEMDYEYRGVYRGVVESLSYIYNVSYEPLHNETVLVFDDESTNALQQLTDVVMSVAMSEINNTIF